MTITRCKIHPTIGVARVGDSPDGFFVGPETPGGAGSAGPYKDGAGRIKRQAARFRVFGYDDDGNVVRELTEADAEIRWTVHLANRKAAAPRFSSAAGLRNPTVAEQDRASLIIDPGEHAIGGRNERCRLNPGTFRGEKVDLGELRTDEDGRLIVLGGQGRSLSPDHRPLPHFADNDGWCDDTSDGPVRAQVTLRTGETPDVDPAWVIVAPPDFAPSITNVVTLHDVVEQVAFDAGRLTEPEKVSFERDIRPFLDRVARIGWVHAAAFRGHRRGDYAADDTTEVERGGDFLDAALMALLSNPNGGQDAADARHRLLRHVRKPWSAEDLEDPDARREIERQATARYMPPLSGDGGYRREGRPSTWLTVTPLQYKRLTLWADGEFVAGADDVGGEPAAGGVGPTPAGLDRAALESCVGGGFFPGIEVSSRIREGALYVEDGSPRPDPYRLDHSALQPGDLTARMAVPWQADFAECEGFWWPAQRPDQVVAEADYRAVVDGVPDVHRPGPGLDTLAFPRRPWARGIEQRPLSVLASDEERTAKLRHGMVEDWSKLAFVVPRVEREVVVWTESERSPYYGLRDRDYFHLMLTLEQHREFRPVARELAEQFLAEARRKLDHDPDLDTELQRFDYDETTFQARLDSIYLYLVDQVRKYDPTTDGTFHSREDVIERVRQYAPLNQTDGAWLRNVDKLPAGEVRDLLSRIRDDETGRGNPQDNHAHIYTELMHDLKLDPAPVASAEYAQDPAFLDSAFTAALLQFVVSEFTEEFLPEILGMTLSFEWESVYLKATAMLFDHYEIDSYFYRLHLAIDNTAAGHGALAVRAVRRYLAGFTGAQLQEQWQRIWDGYEAFREVGTLGDDLKAKLNPQPDPTDVRARMLEMIRRKARYGSLNHRPAAAKGMSNNLFDDPPHLLDVLVEEKLVVPGRPDDSPLLRKFLITGPMYEVFTEQEQQLWRQWIESLQPPAAVPESTPPPAGPTARGAEAGGPPRYKRLLLSSSAEQHRSDPRGRIRGRGAVQ
jgi:hypothetical protein